MNRKWIAAALAAALALPLAGCIYSVQYWLAMEYGCLFFIGPPPEGDGLVLAATTQVDSPGSMDVEVTMGGLNGEYDITLSENGGGEHGTFTGTATVKRGRFIKITATEEDAAFVDAVKSIIAARLGGADVDLSRARGKVSAYQTPGGVESVFKATVTFKGTVVSGEYTGRALKKGKFTIEGRRTLAD